MTSYIIVTRNPGTKKLMVIEEADGEDKSCVSEFETEDEAYEHASTIPICRAWGAEILPVGGLAVV